MLTHEKFLNFLYVRGRFVIVDRVYISRTYNVYSRQISVSQEFYFFPKKLTLIVNIILGKIVFFQDYQHFFEYFKFYSTWWDHVIDVYKDFIFRIEELDEPFLTWLATNSIQTGKNFTSRTSF